MQDRRARLQRNLRPRIDQLVPAGIDPKLRLEVRSIRPSLRTEWNEWMRLQWVIELTQREAQYFDQSGDNAKRPADYYFRGGCTLIVDAHTGQVRYSIKKRLDAARRERQRTFVLEGLNESPAATYFRHAIEEERYAMLHRR
jgi:hypothetical protein